MLAIGFEDVFEDVPTVSMRRGSDGRFFQEDLGGPREAVTGVWVKSHHFGVFFFGGHACSMANVPEHSASTSLN